jgi:HEAT repeat protein
VRALSLLKDRAAIPDLFVALDDPSTLVRHWAEQGLEDLGVGMVFFRAE